MLYRILFITRWINVLCKSTNCCVIICGIISSEPAQLLVISQLKNINNNKQWVPLSESQMHQRFQAKYLQYSHYYNWWKCRSTSWMSKRPCCQPSPQMIISSKFCRRVDSLTFRVSNTWLSPSLEWFRILSWILVQWGMSHSERLGCKYWRRWWKEGLSTNWKAHK